MDYNFEDLLRMDMTGSGQTKRNPAKVKVLEEKVEKLKEYFKGTDVKVKLILDTGFNTLAFISIKGKSIDINNKEILKLIKENASYANIILDNPMYVEFELGYADLSK